MSDIKNGDIVTYPECFGDKPLIFVGMGKTGNYLNDCVVVYDDKVIPVIYERLVKTDPQ